jgi:hypothetical protein
MRRSLITMLVASLVAGATAPAEAYLKLGARSGGRTVTLRWGSFPIRYFVTDRSGGGVSASQLQQAIARGFGSWEAVDTATVSSEFVGFTAAGPVSGDGVTTLGFVNRPDLDRVLGAETVMFPVAFSAGTTIGRALKADDMAGISDVYPAGEFRRTTGSVSGRVTKAGRGVIGAHITAFDPRTGRQVGGFSLNSDGAFTISGLEPGPHVLRVEPLDDGDIDSFFEASLGVDVDFRPKFYERLVVVPRGGSTNGVEIVVQSK